MAGGTFDKNIGKERPGTYVNFVSNPSKLVSGGARGVALIPLKSADYGPVGKAITLTSAAPDAAKAMLGHSIYDTDCENMLLLREAFKGASSVVVYIMKAGATAATGTGGGLSATARYKGSRGNTLRYNVTANPLSGYDVLVSLDGTSVESYEGITDVSALANSEYIVFRMAEGETSLSAVAGVTLAGGTNDEATNGDVTTFLDQVEYLKWNTMAFPFTDEALKTALKAKIKYLRDDCGKKVQAVAPNCAVDYEGIINVTNAYALGNTELTPAQATAYVAGITAGASNVQSNTYKVVTDATAVVGIKEHESAVAAIKAGEFFFSMSENDEVIVEYDINSLVTFDAPKNKSYRKNRVIRVLDTFHDDLRATFPPNKFDNDPDGWEVMNGVGKALLKLYGPKSDDGIGAIKNVDYESDFKVDTELSEGDETYFNVAIQPVDSAEKLFFTVTTS